MTDVSKEEHAETVASLTLKFFKKILNVFPDLKKYDNNDDLLLLKYGAYLHDIGVIFEKKLGKKL